MLCVQSNNLHSFLSPARPFPLVDPSNPPQQYPHHSCETREPQSVELSMLCMQIFVLSSSRIQQRGYDTLFNYTTANPKSGVSKFVKQFPLKRQVNMVVACVAPNRIIQACLCPAAMFLLVPSGAFTGVELMCFCEPSSCYCYLNFWTLMSP